MMNIVERIVIERNGVILARINMLDANDRVINTIKTSEMLAYDDYTIDRETIAELCGMTLDTLNRFYHLDCAGYSKVIDYGVILTEAEFTKKDEFEILLDAIQNGDIKIADDEPEEDEEYENNDVEVDDMWSENCECIAYDRVRGYYLNRLIRDKNGRIAFIDYMSYDDSENITLTRDDLYIDGVELLDYYEDNDYGFKTALRAIIESKRYEEEPEETVIEVPKEEPVMVPHNNMVIAKIQEQMVKAIEKGDFETYDKLEERLNRLNK